MIDNFEQAEYKNKLHILKCNKITYKTILNFVCNLYK